MVNKINMTTVVTILAVSLWEEKKKKVDKIELDKTR